MAGVDLHPLASAAVRRPAGALALLERTIAVGPRHAVAHRRIARRFAQISTGIEEAVHAEIWQGAAAELGAEVLALPDGSLELRRGLSATRVRRSATSLDSVTTRRLSLNKRLGHELLTEAGVAVPKHLEFSLGRLAEASRFLRAAPVPAVVKPANGAGGHGVTPGVRTGHDLVLAALNAARFDHRLLIEHQAPGNMHRLLLLDGELLDVVRRSSPVVVGDGAKSVRELILEENRRRVRARGEAGLQLIRMDLDCELALRRAGLSLRSVPEAASEVAVKASSSENSPDQNETVLARPADSVVEAAAAAANAVGIRLAGVDVVTTDPAFDLASTGGVVIEVNCPPGLQYHYQVRDRAVARKVAVPILRKLLEESPGAPSHR